MSREVKKHKYPKSHIPKTEETQEEPKDKTRRYLRYLHNIKDYNEQFYQQASEETDFEVVFEHDIKDEDDNIIEGLVKMSTPMPEKADQAAFYNRVMFLKRENRGISNA